MHSVEPVDVLGRISVHNETGKLYDLPALPFATSDNDEGSTSGNKKVLDDIMLRQLGLEENVAASMLKIIGGDQSTIEKIRTLKRFWRATRMGTHVTDGCCH